MKRRIAIAALLVVPVVLAAQSAGRLKYPETKKVAQVDDYFGTKVADPYRWLENADAADTRAWVEAENKVTFGYLGTIAERKPIEALLTKLWNYERYGVPSRQGGWYVFTHNEGLQPQSIIYRAKSLDAAPEVLLDPNKLSADGSVAIADATFTDDGKYMAYAIQASGSDWIEWHVREVATARDLPDVIKWSKFSGAAWKKDGSGFFYSRYDAPAAGQELTGVNKDQKLYFHALGSPQEKDTLVYARPDKPDWGLGADVTDDGRYLVIAQSEGTENKNRVFLEDLRTASGGRGASAPPRAAPIEPFLNDFDAEYTVVGNDGDRFYVKTDKGAPRGRLVAIDRGRPAASNWKVLIPEGPGKEVLSNVTMVADRFVAIWQTDAHEQVKIYNLEGQMQREVALPGLGTVGGFSGRRAHKEGFYGYTSFTYPTTIYRYDFAAGRSDVFKKPKTPFNADAFETKQVFYASKDGTRVPMFITARKGMKLDGQNPTYLYGYGGFNIPITPGYSPAMAGWLEMGGIYAVANIRGGSEYGNAWHDAGRLKNKQNVFDDFIAAAE
jgi:prolyl oligopeptidase